MHERNEKAIKERGGMRMAYGIYRVEKRTRGSVKGIQIHNNREKEGVCHTNHDIAWERTKENVTLVACKNYLQEIDKQIADLNLKRKPRKDAIVMLDHFIGGSPEFFEGKTKDETLAYFSDCLLAIEGRFGHVISATIHYDEATPHMHVATVPITKDNRLCAKDLLGNRQALSKIQDWFHKHVFARYNLERGEIRTGENAREHLDSMRYKLETTEKQVQTFQKEVDVLVGRYKSAQNSLKSAEVDLQSLEKKKNEIKGEIRALKIQSKVLSEVEIEEIEVKNVPLQKDKVIIDKSVVDSLQGTAKLVDGVLGQLEYLAKENERTLEKTKRECEKMVSDAEVQIVGMVKDKQGELSSLDREIEDAKSTLARYQKDIRKVDAREKSLDEKQQLIDHFSGKQKGRYFKPRMADMLFKAWSHWNNMEKSIDPQSHEGANVKTDFLDKMEQAINDITYDSTMQQIELVENQQRLQRQRQMQRDHGFER